MNWRVASDLSNPTHTGVRKKFFWMYGSVGWGWMGGRGRAGGLETGVLCNHNKGATISEAVRVIAE